MKVLLIAPTPPPYGGIANWTKMILEYATTDPDVVLDHVNSANKKRSVDGKNIWNRMVGGIVQAIRLVISVKQKLSHSEEYDAAHMTTSGSLGIIRDLWLIRIIKKKNIPIIYHIRFGRFNDIAQKHNWEYRLIARAMKQSSCVLTIDQATYNSVKIYLPNVNCQCIPNPIDLNAIHDLLLHINASENVRKKELVYCGWVLYTKGIEELLKAWEIVCPEHNDWKLRIVGPVKEEYKKYLTNNFSTENVEFTGECGHDEVLRMVAESGVFVFPSHTEGFPNAVVEAMALETPIVASAVGAIPEMLQGECGVCIQPGNSIELADAICKSIDDEESRRVHGINARQKAEREYEISLIWKKYCDVWKELSSSAVEEQRKSIDTKRPRLLLIAYGYFPATEYGGPPISISNFAENVSDFADIYIVTRDHELSNSKRLACINKGWNGKMGNYQVLYLTDSEFSFSRCRQIVDEINPSIIYIQSFFAAQIVIPFLRAGIRRNVPILLAPRGELFDPAIGKKRYKKIPYIKVFGLLEVYKHCFFQATTKKEAERIRECFIDDPDRVLLLSNFPSAPVNIHVKDSMSRRGELKLAFMSRVVPHKNLDLALNALRTVHAFISFDIYGIIENVSYWEMCQDIISKLPSNVSVTYKGYVQHDHLQGILAGYDALILPSKSENYGHIIVEAMYTGVIPVISNRTPWKDLEANEAGYDLELNEDLFTRVLNELADMNESEKLHKSEMTQKYIMKATDVVKLKEDYKQAFERIICQK